MGIDNQVEHVDKVEPFSLDEIDNHLVKLDDFELDEVPDVPLFDHLEIRDRTTAHAAMLKWTMLDCAFSLNALEPKWPLR